MTEFLSAGTWQTVGTDKTKCRSSGSGGVLVEYDDLNVQTAACSLRPLAGGGPMKKLSLTVAAIVIGLAATARAQNLTAEQRTACQGDYSKFCKGVAPGGGRIIACLNKQGDKVSEACRKVLAAQKQ
jgi:cysteine rich repeat protein